MAIFSVKVDNNSKMKGFVNFFQNKLQNTDLFRNPFSGYIGIMNKEKDPFILVWLDIVWPNPIIGALLLTFGVIISKSTWFSIVAMPFLLVLYMVSFVFTKKFAQMAVKYSMRKYGYEGKINMMSEKEMLLRLAGWDKKK